MKPSSDFRSALASVVLSTMLMTFGCGGGNGGSTTTPNTPPPPPPPALLITTTTAPDAVAGKAYTTKLEATGGTGTLTWSAVAMPAGLTIDAATGTVSGTPSTPCSSCDLVVQVVDSGSPPQTKSKNVSIFVAEPLVFPEAPKLSATANIPGKSWWLSPTGGRGGLTYTVDGTVPSGLTWFGSYRYFILSGTPKEAGTFSFILNAKDSANPPQTVSTPVEILVDGKLTVLQTTLDPAVVGRNYRDGITIVNGVPPLTWTVSSWLPKALSLDTATGEIVGVPDTPLTTYLEFSVTDSSVPPQTATATAWLDVYDMLRATSGTLRDGRYNDYYSTSFDTEGGVPFISARVISGTAPPGLSAQGHWFSGTPTQTGTFTFGVQFQDGAKPPQTWNQLYSMTVLPELPRLSGSTSVPAFVGRAVSRHLIAERGTPPYTWAIGQRQPPAGISLSISGLLSGTPQNTGYFPFDVTITDSATPPQTATAALSMTVNALTLGRNDTIPTATRSGPYVQASISPYSDPVEIANPDTDYYKVIANAGGIATVRVDATDDALDPVLELVDANGIRLQTCQDPGNDSPPSPATADTTPMAYDDECLNDDVQLGEITDSTLTLKVPGETGTQTTFYAHVLDFRGDARPDMAYTMAMDGTVPKLVIEGRFGVPPPPGTTGRAYDWTFVTDGGTAPLTTTVAAGNLPPGLALSGNRIFGTPTSVGDNPLTLMVTDGVNPPQSATLGLTIRIADPLVITTASVPSGRTGDPYSATLAAAGGFAPYSWQIAGSFPQGISTSNKTGSLAGTPKQPGDFLFTAMATSQGIPPTYKSFTLHVDPGPLSVATSTLGDAVFGWDYYVQLAAKGGTPTFKWSLVGGNLPPGMVLKTDGSLIGNPTMAGTYSFQVKVTDSATTAQEATGTITISVRPTV